MYDVVLVCCCNCCIFRCVRSTGFEKAGTCVHAFCLSDSIRRLQGCFVRLAVVGWRKDWNTAEHEKVRISSQQSGCCKLFFSR